MTKDYKERRRLYNEIFYADPVNRERKRAKDREYQRKKRAILKNYKTEEYRKYCKNNPEKVKAHRILNRKVKLGFIKRSTCEVCGTSKNIQGHHQDYSKPLLVMWLCPIHHKQIHKN